MKAFVALRGKAVYLGVMGARDRSRDWNSVGGISLQNKSGWAVDSRVRAIGMHAVQTCRHPFPNPNMLVHP
jgi:hypothetical protein